MWFPAELGCLLPREGARNSLLAGVTGGGRPNALRAGEAEPSSDRKEVTGISSGGVGKCESDVASPLLRVLSAKPDALVIRLFSLRCGVRTSFCDILFVGTN